MQLKVVVAIDLGLSQTSFNPSKRLFSGFKLMTCILTQKAAPIS